ncbi:MAG: ion channel [Actinomycetes bacterium]
MSTIGPLGEVSRGRKLWVLVHSLLWTSISVFACLALYFAVPVRGEERPVWQALLLLGAAIVLFGLFILRQVKHILRADHPVLRALQGLVAAIAVFLVTFAFIYLTLSTESVQSFNQPLDRVSALYMTVTVFSTVGFGDLVPVSDTARSVAMVQMLLDLVFLGAVVKILAGVAQTQVEKRGFKIGP